MQTLLHGLVDSFHKLKIIVVGDIVLDRYWWGEASRLSPEAPVPVLVKKNTTARPGGAANTAANVAALGASVELIGLVGEDREADELQQALAQEAIASTGLLRSPSRPTTTKTRLIAGHQHVVRLDEEETAPISNELAGSIAASFTAQIAGSSAVLISDYAKGLLTPYLLGLLLEAARQAAKPVFVDPKGLDIVRYQGATCLKPNRLELGLLTGQSIRNHSETLAAGRHLRDQLNGTNLLVTEAADGMTYFAANGEEFHSASQSRQVFDITGAGDTVLAAFSLSMAAGATVPDALRIASLAAGISIATLGAATVSPQQLRDALRSIAEL